MITASGACSRMIGSEAAPGCEVGRLAVERDQRGALHPFCARAVHCATCPVEPKTSTRIGHPVAGIGTLKRAEPLARDSAAAAAATTRRSRHTRRRFREGPSSKLRDGRQPSSRSIFEISIA